MSISDTLQAKKYASIAEVAAAQAKVYADKLDNAPGYAEDAERFANLAGEYSDSAQSASASAAQSSSSAIQNAESAAESASQAASAAEQAIQQSIGTTLRGPAGEQISQLPAKSARHNTIVSFGDDGDSELLSLTGFALLDGNGKVPLSNIPAAAITEVFVASSQAEMLSSNAQPGDVVKRTDIGSSFILMSSPATTLSNWILITDDVLAQLAAPGGVSLVNGAVSLSALAYGDASQYASPRENSKTIENNVKGVSSNPIVRFATFNIWGSGSVANYYGGNFNSKERLKDLKEAILKSQAAYIGMQECYVLYENPPEHFLIYPHKVSYFGKTNNLSLGRWYGNIFTTAFETSEKSSVVYSSGPGSVDAEYRGYTKSIMTINGVRISVYNTHLSTEDSRIVAMLTELKSTVSSDPSSKIVIMGDLNTQDLSLFKPFEDIGFTVVNKNDINTSVNGVWYIDNILHKGFSSQISRGAQDNKVGLSDHKLLYVDLEL